MDGTATVNPQTGVETTMEAFENTWQAIGTVSGESSAMSMDLTSMCNINLIYFVIAVFIGLLSVRTSGAAMPKICLQCVLKKVIM